MISGTTESYTNNVKLPVSAVVMAGGRGARLMPLTQHTPKSLLKVGGRPVIDYTIRQLQKHGVHRISVAVHYLKEQLEEYVAHLPGAEGIACVTEEKPLGTIGILKQLPLERLSKYVLLVNADAITTIDYRQFFRHFVSSEADMMVATSAYSIEIPYGLVTTQSDRVAAFQEKPRFTYTVNAGIYLLKKELIHLIPARRPYNATDLMSQVLVAQKKLSHFPIEADWIDIGRPQDYERAQEMVKHLRF